MKNINAFLIYVSLHRSYTTHELNSLYVYCTYVSQRKVFYTQIFADIKMLQINILKDNFLFLYHQFNAFLPKYPKYMTRS